MLPNRPDSLVTRLRSASLRDIHRALDRNRTHMEYGSVVTGTAPYRTRFWPLIYGTAYGTAWAVVRVTAWELRPFTDSTSIFQACSPSLPIICCHPEGPSTFFQWYVFTFACYLPFIDHSSQHSASFWLLNLYHYSHLDTVVSHNRNGDQRTAAGTGGIAEFPGGSSDDTASASWHYEYLFVNNHLWMTLGLLFGMSSCIDI